MKKKILVEVRESVNCNGEFSGFVSFDYDANVISVIKSMDSKFYTPAEKTWEIPFRNLNILFSNLGNYDIELSFDNINISNKEVIKTVEGFEFKTKPFNHQIEGFEYGINHNNFLLADQQGLGKTKQTIDIAVAKKLQNGYKHCLIICGVNGLKWNWAKEVAIHSNESAYILGQRRKKSGKLSIGSTKDKLEDVLNLDNIDDYFIITNIETLRSGEIVDELVKKCSDKTIGLIAVDEIHRAKGFQSAQGKGLLKLNSDSKIAMTGTPIMNNPLDTYVILKWLGYEKHSHYQFENHYCIKGGYGGYQIVGYKNMAELTETVNSCMLRRTKEQVLDLPEKTYINEYVEMSAKQKTIYKEAELEVLNNIDRIKASQGNPLACLIRMRQATGFTGILSSTIQESAKLDRMVELVEDATNEGKKVVIFSQWTQMTTPATERLKKYNPIVITGDTKDNERQELVEAFQTNPEVKVAIGTTGAMGTGLTLTAGTVVIFLDEPWTMASKEQAVDRCHRIGTTENVTVYTLIAKDTVDERINTLVAKKGKMSDAMIDGSCAIQDIEEVLNFLLS